MPFRDGDVLLAKVLDASTEQVVQAVTRLWRWKDRDHDCLHAITCGEAAYVRLAVPGWDNAGPCRTTLVPIVGKSGYVDDVEDDDVRALSDLRFVNLYRAFAGDWIVVHDEGWLNCITLAAGPEPRLSQW
jgi:hypothetical protein